MVALLKPQQRKKKVKGKKEIEMRSSLLILDLKVASCRIQKRRWKANSSIKCMFLWINGDLWDRVLGVVSETWKG